MSSARAPQSRASIALIFAVLTALHPSAAAGQVESLTEQIRASRTRLEQIRAEQRRLRSEMNDLSARLHNVSSELENLNRRIRNQETLLREMDYQLAVRDQQVESTTGDLLRTRDLLVEKRVLFARRAKDLYKRGPMANVQIVLAAQNFADLINRYQYLFLIALHDRLLVRQIEELKDLLQNQRNDLKRHVDALRDLRAEKVVELQGLYGLETERGRRLSSYKGQRATAERQLRELRRDEGQLTDLVDRLEKEREAAEALLAASPTRGTLTPEDIGKLDWPIAGTVIYGFGREKTTDGTLILRQGIGIAAPENTAVQAVKAGTVVFSEPYLGYGPSVVLSHGAGYYSVYLYLSELLVQQGESVTAGNIIGRSGGEGTPEGAHLEFQIRQGRQAVDPLPWLRKRRG